MSSVPEGAYERAAEAYRRRNELRAAYRQARSTGGPVAEVLNRPQRIPPGCVGWTPKDDDEYRKLYGPKKPWLARVTGTGDEDYATSSDVFQSEGANRRKEGKS